MIHVINSFDSPATLCGDKDWTEAIVFGSVVEYEREHPKAVDCPVCREEAELDDVSPGEKKVVYRYTATIYTGEPLSERDREYLENHIDMYLSASEGGGEANVHPVPEELDAEESGLEHLLPGG